MKNPIRQIFRRNRGTNDPFGGLDLGDTAKDTLTGFEGIVVATNRNISGCDQIALQPEMKDGAFQESRWFDIERIAQVEAGTVAYTDRRSGADTTPPDRTPQKKETQC